MYRCVASCNRARGFVFDIWYCAHAKFDSAREVRYGVHILNVESEKSKIR